ncbi:hypothetical protein [Hymenobacter sp. GOD-10R]|uniref:hypothetical protein n=1 Tax=Hymenobacter sp. GOD-10R TaxID=3093922 RepID=UPI002D795E80|nr:hypothetical protein [Hymenobacter sp. GOD-10R]WRQ29737.1 hypothetical protein SD425_05600 [Hymenobacter sp. GOD-10R]
MRSFFTRFAALTLLMFVLLSTTTFAATPYTRAAGRGHAYTHRPYYKQYHGTKYRGLMSLMRR